MQPPSASPTSGGSIPSAELFESGASAASYSAVTAGKMHPQQLAAQQAAFHAQDQLRKAVALYLHISCGLIRGALVQLGINCTVEADPKGLPSCAFIVKIVS